MKNRLGWKWIVIGTIVLFIGAIFLPIISSNGNAINGEISGKNDSIINMKGYSVDNYTIKDTVGLWHFDEGTGYVAYDSSEYNNHGICHGTQWTTDTPSGSGYAIKFFSSTNSYVGIDDDPSLDFDDLEEDEGLMIDFWMKKEKTPSGYAGLVAKIYSDGGYSVIINKYNKIGFYLYGVEYGDLETLLSETEIIDTSIWHHIVCVWFEGTMYLFIDDMENPDATKYLGDFQIGDTHKWLDIGNDWPTDNENPFDGFIDEVHINRIIKKETYKTTIIFGLITNVSSKDDLITFDAVKTRCIQFFPYQNLYLTNSEKIILLKDYFGIITLRIIIAICKADI